MGRSWLLIWSRFAALGCFLGRRRPPRGLWDRFGSDLGWMLDPPGGEKTLKTIEKTRFFKVSAIFQESSKERAKKLPKETPGRPKWCPGAPREAQDGPRRRQERPKTAPRAAQSAPRAAQRRSQSGLGGHLGPTCRPRGPRRPPGTPFGPLGGRCWVLRGSIFEAPSACCGAFRGASASARASAGASAKRT